MVVIMHIQICNFLFKTNSMIYMGWFKVSNTIMHLNLKLIGPTDVQQISCGNKYVL